MDRYLVIAAGCAVAFAICLLIAALIFADSASGLKSFLARSQQGHAFMLQQMLMALQAHAETMVSARTGDVADMRAQVARLAQMISDCERQFGLPQSLPRHRMSPGRAIPLPKRRPRVRTL